VIRWWGTYPSTCTAVAPSTYGPDGTPLLGFLASAATRAILAAAGMRHCHPDETGLEAADSALRQALREGMQGEFAVSGWREAPLSPQPGARHHTYRSWTPASIRPAQIRLWLQELSQNANDWYTKVFCVKVRDK